MIQTENKIPFTPSPRQQSLRINDVGYDYVRFTIFDIDYSITDVNLFSELYKPVYKFTAGNGNILNISYSTPLPSEINWKNFIFKNYDAKKKEVM